LYFMSVRKYEQILQFLPITAGFNLHIPN